ncbi:gamma-glutamylcyclotransferase family protein [Rhizobium sp. S163]|uniref:gamma-glutamylcyclotransferase family protein n=1 Tax=Rhizobium sp. S163 TaxID=3055039 RepID=UPI0025A9A663|nr:gamma-glutamylcyclotransferase family protein [Rhizobium sp. S163]MDM9644843.1 gamma-glutamylcyclotransferase family protein [Rhizobium sp. S163]
MKVFIYGTLKRGFPLFEKGLHGARYLGDVETIELYPMYIAGSFYGPMMLDRPGEGLQVRGELFEVEEGRLQTLDELEAVGQEGSFRSTVDVAPVGGGVPTTAIGFMKSEKWLDPLHSGHLSDYQDRRFVPPWDR